MPTETRSYTLSVVARTNDRFRDFAPYVPSINNDGIVAFQSAIPDSGSGVYASDGSTINVVTNSANGLFREVCSHPDINQAGAVCFYATLKSGEPGVFLIRGNDVATLASSFGPLGPTIDEDGRVAFRANGRSNENGIFAGRPGHVMPIADTGPVFKAFQGLPVIHGGGSVLFRADLQSGGQGIYLGDGTQRAAVAETGAMFGGLGAFPTMNDAGAVAFCATLQTGGSGVFVASQGNIKTIMDSTAGFESFRGALINSAGHVVFYATPTGGSLGIFTGPDPVRDRLLAIGSPLFGSTITEFALNPVSINDAGQLAIRVRLADDRQFILRADRAT